jgi:Uma2 family endonuclease
VVGGTNAHSVIKLNLAMALRSALKRGPCRVFGEGPKVVTDIASMYPDAVVVCGEIDFADDQARNPAAIFEALPRSTEGEDRGPKFVAYRSIGSLRHYVLTAQDARRAEVFSRSGDEWTFRIVEPPEALHLRDIGAELSLEDIYEDSGR